MVFEQFRYEPLGQASYLVGYGRSRQAAVVDPIQDLGPDVYVLEAADLGVEIRAALETHVHVDFISWARDLARTVDAPIASIGRRRSAIPSRPSTTARSWSSAAYVRRCCTPRPHARARALSRTSVTSERPEYADTLWGIGWYGVP